MTRFTVHYSGRVQGVGFRYRTVEVARRHAARGYVQNLPDGRVRLVVEGERAALTSFIEDVRATMNGLIDRDFVDESEATGEFGPAIRAGVEVRY